MGELLLYLCEGHMFFSDRFFFRNLSLVCFGVFAGLCFLFFSFFFVGGGYWIQSHNWYTDLLLLLPSPLLYPACAVKAFVCYVTKTAQCWGPNHRSVFLQIPDSRFVLDCIYLRVCLHFLDFRFLRAPFTGTRHVPVFLIIQELYFAQCCYQGYLRTHE